MIFMPFFAAGISAATAFLQAESALWKGFASAAALLLLGVATAFIPGANPTQNLVNAPQIGATAGLLGAAFFVLVGVIASWTLRSRLSGGRVALVTFFGSWILFQTLPFLI